MFILYNFIGLIYLSSLLEDERKLNIKIIVFNVVLIILIISFRTCNLLLIYLFFKVRLMPTFIIVFYWGNN